MEEQQFNVGENRDDQSQLPPDRSISRAVQNLQYLMGTLVEGNQDRQHYPDLQVQSRPIPSQVDQLHSGSGHPQPHPPPQIAAQHAMSPTRPMAPVTVDSPRCCPCYYPIFYHGQHFQHNYQPTPGGWNQMTLPHTGQHDMSQGYYPRVAHQQFQTAHHQYYSMKPLGAAAFPQYPPEYTQTHQQQRYGPSHYVQSQREVRPTPVIQESASVSMPHTPGASMVQSPLLSILPTEDVEEPEDAIVALTRDSVPQPQPQPEIPDLSGVIFAFNELARKIREQEEEIKSLTLKLENSDEREKSLQSKIYDLEEKVQILQLELAGGGGQEVGINVSNTCDLLEENKSLKLEQLELTVRLQMQKMWETIISDLKSRSEQGATKMVSVDEEVDLGSCRVIQPLRAFQQPSRTHKYFHRNYRYTGCVQDVVELQREANPLLIPKILDKIFDSLSVPFLFKCRRVCKLWNKTLVLKIHQNGNNTRVLKIVDRLSGRGTDEKLEQEHPRVKVIDIKEILVTMEAGRLEYSTCTKIHFNDYSMESNPSAFEKFLALNGKNIKVLHYDGGKNSEFKKALKMCAQNLESLSLWGSESSWRFRRLFERDEEPKLIFPKLENITLVSGDDGNQLMRANAPMKHFTYHPKMGRSCPFPNFLMDIFDASPKLNSLSCRLYGSGILKALIRTNSLSKLSSLCLKSRVNIRQLRLLISAKMRLKILRFERLSVAVYSDTYDPDRNVFDADARHWLLIPDDPELMEFGPLLLEFVKTQASTLEYLQLDLFTLREHPDPDIPTDVLLNNFPRMPNLITLAIGSADGSATYFPLQYSSFADLFPKLRNFEKTPLDKNYDYSDYDDIDDFRQIEDWNRWKDLEPLEDADFPANYPVSPNASFSLKNIRNVHISSDLAEFCPFITELHLDGNITSVDGIPFCLPRLKHFYHVVNLKNVKEEEVVLLMIRILNGFMTGISPEECQMSEEEYDEGHNGFERLYKVQLARSRPSIFDLNDLETLDFSFSCHEFKSVCQKRGGRVLSAIEVMISWGISRMKRLKKLRFQFDQKVNSGHRLPDSCERLSSEFYNEDNLEIYSQGYQYYGDPEKICADKNWNLELNLKHHTSEWDQLKFFREDPDIWDLGAGWLYG